MSKLSGSLVVLIANPAALARAVILPDRPSEGAIPDPHRRDGALQQARLFFRSHRGVSRRIDADRDDVEFLAYVKTSPWSGAEVIPLSTSPQSIGH